MPVPLLASFQLLEPRVALFSLSSLLPVGLDERMMGDIGSRREERRVKVDGARGRVISEIGASGLGFGAGVGVVGGEELVLYDVSDWLYCCCCCCRCLSLFGCFDCRWPIEAIVLINWLCLELINCTGCEKGTDKTCRVLYIFLN